MSTWDVVVVGAGPAGSSAAIAARRTDLGASVLLLDRAAFPRDKPCGDGVAPEVFDLLADLGVTDAATGYGPVSTLHLRGPRGASASRPMARPARVIPRAVFDARLFEAARAAGCTVQTHTVREVNNVPDGLRLDDRITARTLIVADGASSPVSRALGLARPPQGHTAVAIRGYAPAEHRDQRIIMDPAGRWPAYAWSFPLADGSGQANVGYGVLVDPRRPVTRVELLGRLRHLMPWTDRGESWRGHLLPLSSWTPRQPDGRVLLAGDAAHCVNPLTGEGIWYAVRTGMLAGQAVATAGRTGGDPGRTYRRAKQRTLGAHLRHLRLLSRVGRTPRLVDAGVAAAGRDQQSFDDLVAMGLTAGTLTTRVLGHTSSAFLRELLR